MKKPKLYQPARQRMTVFSWIIILLLLTMYIFPLFYMVSTSLKTMYEVNLSPPRLLPSDPQWQNFAEAWRKMNFLHYLKNSVIVSVLTILGQLLVCVPCAYAFAKKQFRFKKFLNGLVLFDLVVPAQIIFLSIYLIESKLGWIDTYQGLVVPFT